MRKLFVLATATLGLLAVVGVAVAGRGGGDAGSTDLRAHYPDLRTVVPSHLQLVNEHQRETLRFSNGIANTGPGPWAMRPDPPVADATLTTTAVQEIRSSNDYYKCGEQPKQVTDCYTVLQDIPTGTFEFHQDDLLPDRLVQARRQRSLGGADVLRLLHELPGHPERLGRSVPPVHVGPAARPHRRCRGERLLPRLDGEPQRHVHGARHHEQHRVGEVPAVQGFEGQPQGRSDRALAVREPRHVRGALDESLASSSSATRGV